MNPWYKIWLNIFINVGKRKICAEEFQINYTDTQLQRRDRITPHSLNVGCAG